MSNIAIIPARGGSRRIPHKNIKPFHGKPIIAYSIATAQESGLFDRIIVSTDDDEIAQVATYYGAEVLARPAELARDEVGTQEVMSFCVASLSILSPITDACCIYATAPLMLAEDLRLGRDALYQRKARFSMSVGSNPLRDAGQWYWGMADCFVENLPLISPMTVMYAIPENRVCDINTWLDFVHAEQMYEALHGK